MVANPMPTPNYFTCTLGEAAEINAATKRKFKTINELIDYQALKKAESWAVGFPNPNHGVYGWGVDLFSFKQLKDGILFSARELRPLISAHSRKSSGCVALLCPSSQDFLFAWLGVIRNRFSVLLIAPQCEPEAINHLCKSCDVRILLHDKAYAKAATAAVQLSDGFFKASILPWQIQGRTLQFHLKAESSPLGEELGFTRESESDVAYIQHTSGTSSGLPKPIPQTHHAGVGVLPYLDGKNEATFTTTPLYHGGIADCFRAWTSGALIWIFPGADVPITTNNILSCIDSGKKAGEKYINLSSIKYFSSVPYILQMMAEDNQGLETLRNMKIVGVGGAALPQVVGDTLVKRGINLVSRFGSAECGFLLSSHRNYEKDQDWQYLRVPSSNKFLKFEEQNDASGLVELVVLKGWPHMAKTNHEDGSFATRDLFEQHPIISDAWRYHSRSDSQITLITGKKFDPAPLEEELSTLEYIREAMIFGNGKQQAGVLIFPSRSQVSSETVLRQKIWETVDKINSKGQAYTRISRALVIIMDADCTPLPRSSKGTVLRAAAEMTFARAIDTAYKESPCEGNTETEFVELGQIRPLVEKTVIQVVGGNIKLDASSDFYAHGVDSTMCTRIRSMIERQVFHNQHPLLWNIVYDCGSIERLSEFIIDQIQGNKTRNKEEEEMLDLFKKYSIFKHRISKHCCSCHSLKLQPRVVLLTGATGSLGTEILQVLHTDRSVSQIICLVRAQDSETARLRVSKSLINRRKPPLKDGDNIQCLSSRLAEESLGLSLEVSNKLRCRVTHIIHAAWTVNFSLPLRSFEENIAGVQNLINFANSCHRPAKMIFCSSTASVLGSNHPVNIKEEISSSPSDTDTLGYSRSKWVAEAICSAAEKQKEMNSKVKVLRIGQLTGDTQNGIWNMAEAWPLMLSTVEVLGCLPRLEEILSWLPLDIAAKAVVELSLESHEGQKEKKDVDKEGLVYHVCNNSKPPTWADLLIWIKRERREEFKIVEPEFWLKKLEELEYHPAKNLIGLWRKAFVSEQPAGGGQARTNFETKRAESASEAMKLLDLVDERLVRKIWCWVEKKMKDER